MKPNRALAWKALEMKAKAGDKRQRPLFRFRAQVWLEDHGLDVGLDRLESGLLVVSGLAHDDDIEPFFEHEV
jgi:hypothetical protein